VSLTPLEQEALNVLDQTAARDDLCLAMDMEPGDIQFLNNRLIMHGRADYEDFAETEQRRLMLRLWLTIPDWQKYPENLPHTDVELETSPA
jgi:alpha-ketoglutarate-dependent taurine dioxygenase